MACGLGEEAVPSNAQLWPEISCNDIIDTMIVNLAIY